jgi:2-polyprenyl-6-methoxyphenol hydroxylase-like FAD-dependent oxidoreductase
MASKGKGLQPRTIEVFDDLGIREAVLTHGRTYPVMRYFEVGKPPRDHLMTAKKEPTADVPYPNVIILPQWKTEELLRLRLEELGGCVEYDHEFLGLIQQPGGVEAVVRTPQGKEKVTAQYVIAADGGRSSVRRSLGVVLEGEASSALHGSLIADVEVDGLDREYWCFWGEGKVGLCPLPACDAFQFTAILRPTEQPELTLASVQAKLEAHAKDARLTLRNPTWISVFRPNTRMAEKFRHGRVFLIGDAAHVHTPAGGQGLNTSVQDAYNLGWKMARVLSGQDDGSLLDSYDEERVPVAAEVLGRSERLYRNLDQALAPKRGADEQQLLVNYRGSSLCGPPSDSTTLQPGDRMPNARLSATGGSTCNLFDLMRGPHGLVLSIDVSDAPPRAGDWPVVPLAVRTAPAPHGYRADGDGVRDLSGHVVRVRPDGYIQSISRVAGDRLR